MALLPFIFTYGVVFGQEEKDGEEEVSIPVPTLSDPTLEIEVVADGIVNPTAMALLGPDDILVLERTKGTVQRIVNGEMLEQPLLDVSVNSRDERGLLGIAVGEWCYLQPDIPDLTDSANVPSCCFCRSSSIKGNFAFGFAVLMACHVRRAPSTPAR